MQRKAYVPGLAALLVTLVAGCTSGSGGDGSDVDAKAGVPTTTTAPPGKYRTLSEPCGSVDRPTLRDLLPGVTQLPGEQQEKALKGTAAVTYDTDRRVGCSWSADAPSASHHLVIDVERVVSYDPAVSDADKAQEVYAKRRTARRCRLLWRARAGVRARPGRRPTARRPTAARRPAPPRP